MSDYLKEPWLVAVWPGMGSVALGAGSYLVEKLGATPLLELDAKEFFDIEKVEVRKGVAQPGRTPKSSFFGWKSPADGRDLVIFVGEAQPANRGFEFCGRLLDHAIGFGVKRIFTFAAMATPMHPSADAKVFAVANERPLLEEVRSFEGVTILGEGEISGMNGVLLAAAAERSLPGTCLLGELPFFAIGVPNPKASLAVLRVFTSLASVELDFDELKSHAGAVERGLVDLLERMNRASPSRGEEQEGEQSFTLPTFAKGEAEEESASEREQDKERERERELDPAARRRIEELFERARRDRAVAVELKNELDRLGVFKRFEDRFLDLFKGGEPS